MGVTKIVTDDVDGLAPEFGGFLGGHSGEEAHFDQMNEAGVLAAEPFESLIEFEQVAVRWSIRDAIVERDLELRPTLLRAAGAGVVDQHLAHHTRGDAEEMGTVAESGRLSFE